MRGRRAGIGRGGASGGSGGGVRRAGRPAWSPPRARGRWASTATRRSSRWWSWARPGRVRRGVPRRAPGRACGGSGFPPGHWARSGPAPAPCPAAGPVPSLRPGLRPLPASRRCARSPGRGGIGVTPIPRCPRCPPGAPEVPRARSRLPWKGRARQTASRALPCTLCR